MSLLNPAALLDAPEPSLPWLPGAAFVLVGTATATLFLPALYPPPRSDAMATVLAALLVVLVAFVAAIVARFTFLSFTSSHDEQAREFTVSCGLAGAWYVPVVTLVAQRRWWAILAALLLGWAVGRLLRQCAELPGVPQFSEPLPAAGAALFAAYDDAGLSLGAPYSFGVAAVLHTALFAQLGAQTALAAALTGGGAILLSAKAYSEARPDPAPSRWKERIRFLLNTSLAIAFTALMLVGLPRFAAGTDLESDAQSPGSSGRGLTNRDLISGAILLADTRHMKPLVLPAPRRGVATSFRGLARQTVIEFSGVYWIFPLPRRSPSKDSMIVRESPLNYDFTAVDRSLIRMQAHQDLPSAIDPRCCSAVEVEVRTTDRQPDSIALEVQLGMSDLLKAHRQSLGVQRVSKPGTELLRFPIPARLLIDQFDRIIVDFHLSGKRRNRSANLSIERFILIPAGARRGTATR
ncbi:MAG: hypothetical protein HY821_17825 [Acidobacteria bacterium]|nr:hypothetical protein [Acidobacteriota bacterium]